MRLAVTLQDRTLSAYVKRLQDLGSHGRLVLAAALNEGGALVRQTTVAAEAKQTGLAPDVLARAQKPSGASPYTLSYTIRSQGGDVRLKFFGAKETPSGVEAHPFGHDQVFRHAFMKGGRFPDRVSIAKFNGMVIERIGPKGSTPWSRTVRSGVVIPDEMVKGETVAAFQAEVAVVAPMVVRRLGAMLP